MGIAEALIGGLAGTIGEAGAGALVSGAGMIAGGAAADALGIGGGQGQQIALSDSSIALDYYKQAAAAQSSNYLTGLNYYKDALTQAGQVMQQAYLNANSTLKPLSQASNDALNEQLRFMGMNPISATVSYADRFAGTFSGAQYNDIANTLRNAENIQDPNERAAVKQQILDQAKTLSTAQKSDYSSIGERPKILSYADWLKAGAPVGDAEGHLNWDVRVNSPGQDGKLYDLYTQTVANGAIADWDKRAANIDAQQKARNEQNAQVAQFLNTWGSQYTDEFQRGYTGDEITQKLQATPGYQFQMDQGTKAIARSQAARGMLRSGNTQLAIQEYGQGLANQTYNQYMDRLAGIINQGSGATGQISANQVGQGDYLGGLLQQGGLASMETYRGIGDYTGNTLIHSGDMQLQNQQFNAQQANAILQTSMNNRQSGQNAALGAAAGLMNANTNAGYLGLQNRQFNYGIYRNNQVGSGYI